MADAPSPSEGPHHEPDFDIDTMSGQLLPLVPKQAIGHDTLAVVVPGVTVKLRSALRSSGAFSTSKSTPRPIKSSELHRGRTGPNGLRREVFQPPQ